MERTLKIISPRRVSTTSRVTTDGNNEVAPIKELDIEEILEQIGPYGFMQKFYVCIFCFLVIPSTYQTLLMYFVGYSPDWECVGNSTECNMTGIFTKTDNRRCQINRNSWQYTKHRSFSVVTEVLLKGVSCTFTLPIKTLLKSPLLPLWCIL